MQMGIVEADEEAVGEAGLLQQPYGTQTLNFYDEQAIENELIQSPLTSALDA